jgi:hypothetical protein
MVHLKISKDPTGNKIPHLPSCGALPQPIKQSFKSWKNLQNNIFFSINEGKDSTRTLRECLSQGLFFFVGHSEIHSYLQVFLDLQFYSRRF